MRKIGCIGLLTILLALLGCTAAQAPQRTVTGIEVDASQTKYWYLSGQEIDPAGVEELRFVTRTYNKILKENKQVRERLSHEASHDALTGLFNRGAYDLLMESADTEHMALILIDVAYFKEVNDTFGHRRGDDILKEIAKYMLECFPDGVVSRLGGDEFTVIMERLIPEHEVERRCEQLDKNVCSIFRAGDLRVSISYGISVTNGNRNIDGLLREADNRMYERKRNRRGEQ